MLATSLAQSGIAKVVLAAASIAAAVLLLSEYWRYMACPSSCGIECRICVSGRCSHGDFQSCVKWPCVSVRRPQLLLVGNVTVDLVDGKRALVMRHLGCNPAISTILACGTHVTLAHWDIPYDHGGPYNAGWCSRLCSSRGKRPGRASMRCHRSAHV